MACLETDEVFVVWLLDWRCGLDSKKTTYKSNWISNTNGKNRKNKKTKTKQKRPNRHTSVKTEFFFPRLRAVPYLFLKSGPCPHKFGKFWNCILFYPDSCGLCRTASKTGGFGQQIHWFCVDERLNLVKQYLTSEKSDSLGPKLSALQLWDCLGEHIE